MIENLFKTSVNNNLMR